MARRPSKKLAFSVSEPSIPDLSDASLESLISTLPVLSPEPSLSTSPINMDAPDRAERRRLQNRQAQRNHRSRVKAYISSLEQRVIENILQDSQPETSLPISPPETVASKSSEASLELPAAPLPTLSSSSETCTSATSPMDIQSQFSTPLDYYVSDNFTPPAQDWDPITTHSGASCYACPENVLPSAPNTRMHYCECGFVPLHNRITHHCPLQEGDVFSSGGGYGTGLRDPYLPQPHRPSSLRQDAPIMQHHRNDPQAIHVPVCACVHPHRAHASGSCMAPRPEHVYLVSPPNIPASHIQPENYAMPPVINPHNRGYQQYALVPVVAPQLHAHPDASHLNSMAYPRPRYRYD